MTVDLSMINPGDEVTVETDRDGHTALTSGAVWKNLVGTLCVGWEPLRWHDGTTADTVARLVSHIPALPDWATDEDVVAVIDRDDDVWVRRGNRWHCAKEPAGIPEARSLNASYGPCRVYARRADR